ncbi:MAG: iron-containing alcohol dehydrogenase [Spirochaetaceae bacterium]|nr:MAG: iron-containing alcohol dehydrogenase [Spirochaetaceae bacterium]
MCNPFTLSATRTTLMRSIPWRPPLIKPIQLRQPGVIEFGVGRRETLRDHLSGVTRILAVVDPAVRPAIDDVAQIIESTGRVVEWITEVVPEPPIHEVERLRSRVRAFAPDCVIGIGGGSAIDLAKILSILSTTDEPVSGILGIDLVTTRTPRLIALPTTSGTGSEVTPIAVLTDTDAALKKGVVSRYLIPDVAIVDPALTVSSPAPVTASTGIDALTHCIEAFTNVHAHPAVDIYALEGIRLIAGHVARAVADGTDLTARSAMALGSLYGGLCLGPVNTAAVHALAYPLGGSFKVPHGVANSMLLPHVMRFNLPACALRYVRVAEAMGVIAPGIVLESDSRSKIEQAASAAVDRVVELSRECGIPRSLTEFGVRQADIDTMAKAAVLVTRLMNNNPRTMSAAQASEIYRQAL